MVDLKPILAEKLGDLAAVGLSFGKTGRKLPVLILTETGNSAQIVLNGRERVSRVTIQIDVYASSAKETEALAASVNERLTGMGLRRSFSQLLTDGDVPRRCMRFTCGIDEVSGRTVSI